MASHVPTTMFAWRKQRGQTEPIWEEVPVPKVTPTGVLCRLLASGVCRSDHSLLNRDQQASWFKERYTLGHEGCGRVVEIGQDVKDPDFKVGDIVALFAVPGCGETECLECTRDLAQICEKGQHAGVGHDGFHAPYAVLNARGIVPVPKGVTPAQAAVATDAVTTAYHAIHRRAHVNKNEIVFLFGLGGLGFNALQVLRTIGARVIVAEIKQDLLDDAAALGIPTGDMVPLDTTPQDFIRDNGLTGYIDTVLDFVGTHQTFEDAHHIARRGGKIICVGSLDSENTLHMKVGTRKRLSFIFSYGGQVKDLKEVLELIAKREIVPMVKERKHKDFPDVLNGVVAGKINGRAALTFD